MLLDVYATELSKGVKPLTAIPKRRLLAGRFPRAPQTAGTETETTKYQHESILRLVEASVVDCHTKTAGAWRREDGERLRHGSDLTMFLFCTSCESTKLPMHRIDMHLLNATCQT